MWYLKSNLFPKLHHLYVLFIFFDIFFFFFHLSILVKKLCKFLWCLIVWIRVFMKEFWKILELFFLRNRDIWNQIFFKNSIVYYSFFFNFLTSFFLFHLSILVKKFWIFLKENWDIWNPIWNPNFFQNSIVYYFCLHLFFSF